MGSDVWCNKESQLIEGENAIKGYHKTCLMEGENFVKGQ